MRPTASGDPFVCGTPVEEGGRSLMPKAGAVLLVVLGIVFALLAGAAPAAFALHILSGAFGAPAGQLTP